MDENEATSALGGSMTKAELVEEVSKVSDLTKKHSEVIVDTVFRSIITALHRGEKNRAEGLRQFPPAAPRAAQGTQSQDRRQGGRPAEEGASTSSPARSSRSSSIRIQEHPAPSYELSALSLW
jgi:nucleoid DNA-binding protein